MSSGFVCKIQKVLEKMHYVQSVLIIEKSMLKCSSIFCAHKISPGSWKNICCWGCKKGVWCINCFTEETCARVQLLRKKGGLLSDESVEINQSIAKESNFSDEETRTCSRVILLSNKTEAKLSIPVEGQKKKKKKARMWICFTNLSDVYIHTEWLIWQICFHIWLQRLVIVRISGQNESSRAIIRQAR